MVDVQLGLTSVQQRVAEELLGLGEERPVADLTWGPELADWIDDALADHSGRPGPDQWRVSKGVLSGVHGCEAHFLITKGDFTWSRQAAKGVVVHRAIALAAAGGSSGSARALAQAAIDQAREGDGRSLGGWLGRIDDEERAALVADAVPGIDGFLSAFPPLKATWNPVAEYPVSATIGDGRVRVAGRVDLVLEANRRDGDCFLRRRRLFIEVKTGMARPEHRAEHLLYALVETLRSGVAPFRAVTYYTEHGTWVADDITKELLVVAGRRLIDGTQRFIELDGGREPARRPGWRCAYCPLAETCPERLAAEEDHLGTAAW